MGSLALYLLVIVAVLSISSAFNYAFAATLSVEPSTILQGGSITFVVTTEGGPELHDGAEKPASLFFNGPCTNSYALDFFFAPYGIDFNAVLPGPGWTDFNLLCRTWSQPGDYIATLQYRLFDASGTSTIHRIDVPFTVLGDRDRDGIIDADDNCPNVPNPDQMNSDNDRLGDACDPFPLDPDNDGIDNVIDNCPTIPNPDQADSDGDRLGNVCDPNPFDFDNDGFPDADDNCPTVFNPDQDDTDGNGVGNACETDLDGDGVPNTSDNCPLNPNSDQTDSDLVPDGMGDACDPPDSDGDGVLDNADNCPQVSNPSQRDANGDGQGDACDQDDSDGDGIEDFNDNCPAHSNPGQEDDDFDGLGNICETDDVDGDGHSNVSDNCPNDFNPGQFDDDGDGIGDVCDPNYDPDLDGIAGNDDNCELAPNPGQQDANNNGIGDACDNFSDTDGDGLMDSQEVEIGSDPNAPTPLGPGINPYSDGQPTSSSNEATAGNEVGVAISPPDGVDSVGVTVTNPNGDTAFEETLIPQSPVVFSFTPDSCGEWKIDAELFSGLELIDTLSFPLFVVVDADGDGESDLCDTGEPVTFETIIEKINDMDLHNGIKNSLVKKIENAQKSFDKGNIKSSINTLNALIHEVNAQTGKKITQEQAYMIIDCVNQLVGGLSSPVG